MAAARAGAQQARVRQASIEDGAAGGGDPKKNAKQIKEAKKAVTAANKAVKDAKPAVRARGPFGKK